MKKTICSVLLVLFSGVFLFSVFKILQLKQEYDSGSDSYSALNAYVSLPELTVPADMPDSTHPEGDEPLPSLPEENTPLWPAVDFQALAEINPDIVAWIYIPGTDISYPVVQGRDNDYYLYHMFDGGYNRAGCVFLDVNVAPDFSARNSVLHGHNLLNGTMFAGLLDYRDQSFYDAHPEALLLTPDGNYRVALFSGYLCGITGDAWDAVFLDGEYPLWLARIAGKSCFRTSVVPTVSDRVLTLSTCSYEFSDARFVLHGILIPGTE